MEKLHKIFESAKSFNKERELKAFLIMEKQIPYLSI